MTDEYDLLFSLLLGTIPAVLILLGSFCFIYKKWEYSNLILLGGILFMLILIFVQGGKP